MINNSSIHPTIYFEDNKGNILFNEKSNWSDYKKRITFLLNKNREDVDLNMIAKVYVEIRSLASFNDKVYKSYSGKQRLNSSL
jgi:hypothetical protein